MRSAWAGVPSDKHHERISTLLNCHPVYALDSPNFVHCMHDTFHGAAPCTIPEHFVIHVTIQQIQPPTRHFTIQHAISNAYPMPNSDAPMRTIAPPPSSVPKRSMDARGASKAAPLAPRKISVVPPSAYALQ